MSCAPNDPMTTKTEKIKIDYKGKQVSAHKLTVNSEIPIDIDIAWSKVQTSALLNFVCIWFRSVWWPSFALFREDR